jgi:hypothetical protein
MIEALFLNDKGTFLRFEDVKGDLVPVFLEGDSERRFEFNRSLHAGTLEYIDKVLTVTKNCFGSVDLGYFSSQSDICSRYFSMLKMGCLRDARTFSSITFENFFAGKEVRYLVPPASASGKMEGIWREGTLALAKSLSASKPAASRQAAPMQPSPKQPSPKQPSPKQPSPKQPSAKQPSPEQPGVAQLSVARRITLRAKIVLVAFYPILKPHLSENERKNYRADPHFLFGRSKHPVMRFVGAAAGLRKTVGNPG